MNERVEIGSSSAKSRDAAWRHAGIRATAGCRGERLALLEC